MVTKNLTFAFVLSIITVVFLSGVYKFLHFLSTLHLFTMHLLAQIPSHGLINPTVQKILALFLVPLIITTIPTFIYWLFTRKTWPFFLHLFWFSWITFLITLVIKI